MYKQTLWSELKDYINPKILKKIIGIKNGSMVIMLNMILFV